MHIWFPKYPVFFVNGVQSNIPVTAYNEIRSIGIGPASSIDLNIVETPTVVATHLGRIHYIQKNCQLRRLYPMKQFSRFGLR